jgi:hypothetical protein
MYYLVHLALPAIAALVMIIAGSHIEWSFSWLAKAFENFGATYMLLAFPHWVWASATAYYEASEGSTVGGFIGAHVLLVGVALFVAFSNSPEAANGWFIYLFGSPFSIAVGALAGRKMSQWKIKRAA